MRMLVLGAGLQGSACAYDLLRQDSVERVTLADLHPERVPAFVKKGAGKRLKLARLDAERVASLRKLMKGHDAVMCAVPYFFNFIVSKAAVAQGLHACDLGGNTEIVMQQKKLQAQAKKKGLSIIPDCGVAPGMVNILAAEGIRRVGEADTVKIYVGGLPQHPEPPLNYQVVYSLEGVLDYYTTPSWVLREGKPAQVEALSELEHINFPAPVGRLEAFHTGGGISSMPWTYAGKIRQMEYKTLRYPGHVAIMHSIRELGLLDLKPVKVQGETVIPRKAFISIVSPKLTKPKSQDLVALRVEVTGKGGQRAAWELIDYYDATAGVSAMMRTTGYSLAITGLMQADGRITAKGVHTPDEAVPFQPYVDELAKRGINIREI